MTNEHPKLRKDRAGVISVGGDSNGGGPMRLYAALKWLKGSPLFSVSWWLQLLSGLVLIILAYLSGCAPGYYETGPAYREPPPTFSGMTFTNPETEEEEQMRIWRESIPDNEGGLQMQFWPETINP